MPAAAPDVVFLPGSDVRCIPTEQILLSQLSSVFSTYTVEEATAFCVTRNADINPEDEAFDFDDDFRGKMRKVLGKRPRLDRCGWSTAVLSAIRSLRRCASGCPCAGTRPTAPTCP